MATLAQPKHLRIQTQNLKSVLPPYHTFELLKSTRQGDFASLNEDLIYYNQNWLQMNNQTGVTNNTMHKPTASD